VGRAPRPGVAPGRVPPTDAQWRTRRLMAGCRTARSLFSQLAVGDRGERDAKETRRDVRTGSMRWLLARLAALRDHNGNHSRCDRRRAPRVRGGGSGALAVATMPVRGRNRRVRDLGVRDATADTVAILACAAAGCGSAQSLQSEAQAAAHEGGCCVCCCRDSDVHADSTVERPCDVRDQNAEVRKSRCSCAVCNSTPPVAATARFTRLVRF
jgi:hypothetical protein